MFLLVHNRMINGVKLLLLALTPYERMIKIMAGKENNMVPEFLIIDDEETSRRLFYRVLGEMTSKVEEPLAIVMLESSAEALEALARPATEATVCGALVDGLEGGCWPVFERLDELFVPGLLFTGREGFIRQAGQLEIPALLKPADLAVLEQVLQETFPFLRPTV
jgi:hypothetical protein